MDDDPSPNTTNLTTRVCLDGDPLFHVKKIFCKESKFIVPNVPNFLTFLSFLTFHRYKSTFPADFYFFAGTLGTLAGFFLSFYRSGLINQRFQGFLLKKRDFLKPLKNKAGTLGTLKTRNFAGKIFFNERRTSEKYHAVGFRTVHGRQ